MLPNNPTTNLWDSFKSPQCIHIGNTTDTNLKKNSLNFPRAKATHTQNCLPHQLIRLGHPVEQNSNAQLGVRASEFAFFTSVPMWSLLVKLGNQKWGKQIPLVGKVMTRLPPMFPISLMVLHSQFLLCQIKPIGYSSPRTLSASCPQFTNHSGSTSNAILRFSATSVFVISLLFVVI